MGNPFSDGAPAEAGAATIHAYYSDASWIEGAAEDQLHQTARLAGVREIAAFPDLHPGKYGPVGSAILADRLHPLLIGNDIGCGMSLFALDIPARKVRLDKAAERMRAIEGPWAGDAGARLEEAGLADDLNAEALGSIGGGNHFCELQGVESLDEGADLAAAGLSRDSALLLVHSGSRALGAAIFATILDAREGLSPDDDRAAAYLHVHDEAVAWARLNRAVIAERAAAALGANCRLVSDAPHNLVEVRGDAYLHRKGAAKADMALVPLAGSRDAPSFLVRPLDGCAASLSSLAHGSGRKYDRRSMTGRVGRTRSERDRLTRNAWGGHVVCDDRALLVEEAASAYKDPRRVLRDLEEAGLVSLAATLKPLVTFKKSAPAETREKTDGRARHKDGRRRR